MNRDDPDAVTKVRCTNGGSRDRVPLRIEPERGKVSQYGKQATASKCPDVLHDDDRWSYVANEACKVAPQSGPLTRQTGTLAGRTDVLAREPAADGPDVVDSKLSKSGSVEGSHVVMAGHSGPVFRQHPPAPGVDLAEGDCPEGPRAFKAQAEPADA